MSEEMEIQGEEAAAETRAELQEVARAIRRWQEDRGLTTSAMIRKFGGLGSDKTYSRCVKGDFEGLDAERQLAKFRAVWALIEATGEGAGRGEEVYDDLAGVVQLREAFLECTKKGGNARFILVTGDTGSGKTSAARSLMAKYGARIVFMELSPVAGDSPFNFVLILLKALGIDDPPKNAVAAFQKAVDSLKERPRCVVIDELHHAGPKILNTIKALLNATPGVFVGLAMPTLWYRMEKAAYEECRQLTGNRLKRRIRIDKLNRSDLRKFVARRVPKLAEAERAVQLLESAAQGRGNLAFVRGALERAAEMCGGEAMGLEDFAAAVKAEAECR